MSWTDKSSIEVIKDLKEIFKVYTIVETGTHVGINAKLLSYYFYEVLSVEKEKDFYNISKEKLKHYQNVKLTNSTSSVFLKKFINDYKKNKRSDMVIFYLDAHFYNPQLTKERRFVILEELEALKGFENCIIIIHDFDNNLGHITYDGISLDINLLKKDLIKVNSNFKFYTNELSSCDIVTKEDVLDDKVNGLEPDFHTLQSLDYVWSKPDKTYRGLLYCIPEEVIVKGIRKLNAQFVTQQE